LDYLSRALHIHYRVVLRTKTKAFE
jgi:hypothetical protein